VDLYENDSSNQRELEKIVISLEEYAAANPYASIEMFMFTDSFVPENAYYQGTSSNPILFELISRL
jgi:hypothetical protein